MKFVPFLLLFLFSAAICSAAGNSGAILKGNLPIQLKSDQLITDSAGRTATFTGRVVAIQGDLTIYADTLVVRYAESKKDVHQVIATGNVRIIQGERQGFAERAVYDNLAGLIRLEERPRVQQGEDTIRGAVILYYVNEQKSVVEGSAGQRVEAVIHPGGKIAPPRP